MDKTRYFLSLTLIFLLGLAARAQDTTAAHRPEMADAFRSNGKIFVVIAVLVTILLGLFLYVMRLDWKIRKLEQRSKK
jgi:hypothetical protein